MLTEPISEVLTYAPLQHSLVVSVGATLLALIIGSTLAWMVIRTDMPGRNIINTLATVPYIMPSWTSPSLDGHVQKPHDRRYTGSF